MSTDASSPAIAAEAVIPHASTNFPGGPARALYIGVSGDVVLITMQDQVVTFKAVPVGILPVQCKRVNAVNTTATDMVALR